MQVILLGAKRKFGVVLTITTAAAFVWTVVMATKKAPEALEAKQKALEEKRAKTNDENAQLTWVESIKAQMPCYAPVIAGGAVAVTSAIGSQILPQSALNDFDRLHKTYKDITAKVNSPKAEQLISKMTSEKLKIANREPQKEWFVIHFRDDDILFESTFISVLQATYDINKLFSGIGTVTFNQALGFFKQPEVEDGEDYGWDTYLGEAFYGYSWIDFEYRQGKFKGKDVTFIDMTFDPHCLTEEELEEEGAVEFGGEWTQNGN